MSEVDQTDGTGVEPEGGMPRWVKTFIAVTAVLVLAFAATKLLGTDHGPGRHGGDDPPAADTESQTSPVDH